MDWPCLSLFRKTGVAEETGRRVVVTEKPSRTHQRTDLQLAQELVRRKLLPLRAVRVALAELREAAERGQTQPWAGLLVERGSLPVEDLKEVLSNLGWLRLSCETCRIRVKVSRYKKGRRYQCKTCSGILEYVAPSMVDTPSHAQPTMADSPGMKDVSGTDFSQSILQAPSPGAGEVTPVAAHDGSGLTIGPP